MNHRMFLPIFCALAVAIAGCGRADRAGQNGSGQSAQETGRGLVPTAQMITVTDAVGQPIPGAQILIGQAQDVPFRGNFLTADTNGQVAIPDAWNTTMTVTVDAPGFVRTTYFERDPSQCTFKLRRSPPVAFYQIFGETTGYKSLNDGKNVHVGLVLPAFSRRQLPTLDVASLMSQDADQISVMNRTFDIPSNLAIPTQTADYIISIELSKPNFRIFLPEEGQQNVSVTHVSFPIKDVVGELQKNGLNIARLAGFMKFHGGSFRSVVAGPKPAKTTLAVTDIAYTPSVKYVAPAYAANHNLSAIALVERGGEFMVSDMKGFKPGAKGTLSGLNDGKGVLVELLRPNQQKESTVGVQNSFLSLSIAPVNSAPAGGLLEIVKAPEVRGDTLVLTPPKTVAGVNKVLTRVVLQKIDVLTKGKYQYEKKTPRWELFASEWTTQMTLPKWPTTDVSPAAGMRWESEFAGSTSSNTSGATPIDLGTLEKITHVTRSALDL